MLQWDVLDRLAKNYRKNTKATTFEEVRNQLELWWCLKYSRPFKDPLLQDYTLDELAFEFLMHYYVDPANDPIKKDAEQSQQAEDEDWVLQQLGKIKQEQSGKPNLDVPEPAIEPEKPQPSPFDDLPEISTTFDA